MIPPIQFFFLFVFVTNVNYLCGLKTRKVVPGAYIVEFSSSFTRLRTNNHHELFYRNILDMNTAVTPSLNFTSPLFVGASFHLVNSDDISAIEALDSVSAIWPVAVYSRPTARLESITDMSKFADDADDISSKDPFPPHVMTGVDKLHAQGYTGENVTIAIIDTGVDYRHPALGGGFGLGYKIQFGYDFVGDNYTGYNLPIPDSNPFDCNGHGTHVSGIIGANSPIFTGVAPNATLGMYRVFGCAGSTTNDVLIAAFTAAHEAGAQIITASLGNSSGWTEDPMAIVVSRIARSGILCIIAVGNDGKNGLFFTATPATGVDVIAVGSVNSIATRQFMYQGYFSPNSELNTTFSYFPSNNPFPTNISGYPLHALGFNTSNPGDACNELPPDTPELSKTIVLIRRGTCGFSAQIANVQKFGTKYIIFYNDGNPIINPQSATGILTAMVPAELGAQWIVCLKAGHTINLYFSDNTTVSVIATPNNVTGGTMSRFSSWSPTNELYVKPVVSAPGGNILSTYPLQLGSYATLSGTSMATAYIAGVVALHKSAKDSQTKLDYQILRQILSTTATPLYFNDGKQTYSHLAPVAQQGGGLVNAFAAVHYTTFISPSTLSLNDTVHFNQTVELTILNTDSMVVSYTLAHQGAATVYTLGVNTTFPQIFPPDLNTQYATAVISPVAVIVPGKSTAVIRVTFSRPSMLETQRIPVFSGYITIQSSKNESFHLSYAGVDCNMKQVMLTDFERRPPYISNSSDTNSIPNSIGTNTIFNVTTDQPNFNWRLVMGSALVRLDILGSGRQNEVVGVNILGSVPDFPRYWVARNDLTNSENQYKAAWNGKLSTGDRLPAGNYSFLYRALKIFGDPDNNSDYENWTSPMFRIEYDAMMNRAQIEAIYSIKLLFFLIVIFFSFHI